MVIPKFRVMRPMNLSMLDRSKIMGEQVVWQFSSQGLPTTIIRPVSIYRPRGKDFTLEIGNLILAGSMAVVLRLD